MLRAAGLDLVYSDRLVAPELRVEVEPGGGTPAEQASRILATHGLGLDSQGPGSYVVVRRKSATQAPDSGAGVAGDARPGAAAAGLAPAETITVYASRYRVDPVGALSAAQLSRVDLAALPGLDEDVLRVTRYLPGTATNGLSARANVRGGRDDEVAVLFDGVPLLAPFHFKDYQAVLGILDPQSIDRLDFFSGVFPARYGDRLSGVMDIAPRTATDGNHHKIGLSMLSAHALSVGESRWRDRPVRWLVSGRRSVTQAVARLARKDNIEPEFTDVLLRAETQLGDWTATLGGLALQDELIYVDRDAQRDDRARASYRDAVSWLKLRRPVADGVVFEVTLSGSNRHTDRSGSLARAGSVAGTVRDLRDTDSSYLRFEAHRAGRWTLGAEATRLSADYTYDATASFDPLLAQLFGRAPGFVRGSRADASGAALAAYGSYLVEPVEHWRMEVGLRADQRRYRSRESGRVDRLDASEVSPRVALEYQLDEQTTVRASAGRATQAERPDELQVADGAPTFSDVQVADQVVLGVERRVGARGLLRAEAYRKDIADPAPRYENLLDPIVLLPELEVDRRRVAPRSSLLYGVELSARQAFSARLSGWLSYSWSEATDRFETLDALRSWNQRHSVAAGVAWSRSSWDLSANLLWHSGWRRTRIGTAAGGATPQLTLRNSSDWPDYFSLDLRAAWARPLARGTLRVYADASNVTQHLNPCCTELAVSRSPAGTSLQQRERGWLPRYVIVGASWELP